MSARRTVLVVEDEDFVRDSLVAVLQDAGYEALPADGVKSALEALRTHEVHAVLADLHMPAGGGQALLEAVRERGWQVPVVVITGAGTIAHAVEAMRAGAFDFVQKPVEPDQLVLLVQRAVEHERMGRDLRTLRAQVERGGSGAGLVGDSPALRKVREQIAQVAPTDTTVLVTGESGTGKELVAERLHQGSPRRAGNLVRVNCAAIPDALFESEFFGHRQGAFTGAVGDRTGRFAEAEGGTLVLDEIGSLKHEMQAKLLRVLESGDYQVVGESGMRKADARIVAVTNESLAERVREGTFRSDLYYRVAIFPIHTPPLRELKGDLAQLTAHLLAQLIHGRDAGAAEVEDCLPDEVTLELLGLYDWPGNVRELRNLLERALILAGGRVPDASVIGPLLEPVLSSSGSSEGDLHLRTRLEALERSLIQEALERSDDVRKDAAALLGIDARNMGYYLRKHGLADAPARRDRGDA